MLSCEVKELINLLKTKMTVTQTKIEREIDGVCKEGVWYFFEDSTEDHDFFVDLVYYPNDPKELEQQKEEE